MFCFRNGRSVVGFTGGNTALNQGRFTYVCPAHAPSEPGPDAFCDSADASTAIPEVAVGSSFALSIDTSSAGQPQPAVAALAVASGPGWSLLQPSTPHGSSVPKTLPAWATNLDVGVVYVLDVFQWVPYAGLLVGGYDFAGGTIPGSKPYVGAALALGLDYRIRPRWTVGVAVRQHMVSDTTAYPSLTQAFARLEYVWGGW